MEISQSTNIAGNIWQSKLRIGLYNESAILSRIKTDASSAQLAESVIAIPRVVDCDDWQFEPC